MLEGTTETRESRSQKTFRTTACRRRREKVPHSAFQSWFLQSSSLLQTLLPDLLTVAACVGSEETRPGCMHLFLRNLIFLPVQAPAQPSSSELCGVQTDQEHWEQFPAGPLVRTSRENLSAIFLLMIQGGEGGLQPAWKSADLRNILPGALRLEPTLFHPLGHRPPDIISLISRHPKTSACGGNENHTQSRP